LSLRLRRGDLDSGAMLHCTRQRGRAVVKRFAALDRLTTPRGSIWMLTALRGQIRRRWSLSL
jgi:hypothetical protein